MSLIHQGRMYVPGYMYAEILKLYKVLFKKICFMVSLLTLS